MKTTQKVCDCVPNKMDKWKITSYSESHGSFFFKDSQMQKNKILTHLSLLASSYLFSRFSKKQAENNLPSASRCVKLFRDIRSTRKWINWFLVCQRYIAYFMVYIIAHQPLANEKANDENWLIIRRHLFAHCRDSTYSQSIHSRFARTVFRILAPTTENWQNSYGPKTLFSWLCLQLWVYL